uniref:Uncharacterized protein n=1 Tax=Virus NIOZ-UU159 TaxID=2763270 RepID=A0A7S9SV70_9VIRU|nr:MAG: hypothetical protein NIOZUU159_00347 [Virus NIOZ-UU159]
MQKSKLNYIVEKLFYDNNGQIIVSAIFGLSIAIFLFYIPVKIVDNVFKYNNKCYILNKNKVECTDNSITL